MGWDNDTIGWDIHTIGWDSGSCLRAGQFPPIEHHTSRQVHGGVKVCVALSPPSSRSCPSELAGSCSSLDYNGSSGYIRRSAGGGRRPNAVLSIGSCVHHADIYTLFKRVSSKRSMHETGEGNYNATNNRSHRCAAYLPRQAHQFHVEFERLD